MPPKNEPPKTTQRKRAVETARALARQCDGKPGEIIFALQQAIDGEAFKILVASFRQLQV
jgi:recombinational DNA repair protein RecR